MRRPCCCCEGSGEMLEEGENRTAMGVSKGVGEREGGEGMLGMDSRGEMF